MVYFLGDYHDLWSKFARRRYFLPYNFKPGEDVKYGCPLIDREKDNFSDTIIEIILKIIVPVIENKISSLDAHITLNKKGLKNTVKVSFKISLFPNIFIEFF